MSNPGANDDAAPLRRYVAVRLGIAAVLLASFSAALTASLVNMANWRRFEQRSPRTQATVVGSIPWTEGPDEDDWLIVEYTPKDQTVRTQAPIYDRARYRVGQQVEIVYDPRNPERIRITDFPYDPFYSLFGSALIGVPGLVLGARTLWWRRKVIRLAATPGPRFAVLAVAAPSWGPKDLYLFPLNAPPPLPPALRFRLVSAQAASTPTPFHATARGELRPGGVVVVTGDGKMWWPRSQAKTSKHTPPPFGVPSVPPPEDPPVPTT